LPLLGNLMIYIQILYNKNELGAPIWFRYSARVGPLGVHGKAMERTRRHRLNHNPDPDEGQTLNMRHKECIRDVIQRCVPINQIGFNGTISRCNCLCGRGWIVSYSRKIATLWIVECESRSIGNPCAGHTQIFLQEVAPTKCGTFVSLGKRLAGHAGHSCSVVFVGGGTCLPLADWATANPCFW
jgi:hypothetical protein